MLHSSDSRHETLQCSRPSSRQGSTSRIYTEPLSVTPLPPGLPVTSSAGRCCTASNCTASCLRLLPAVALHAASSRCSQPSTRKARWYRDRTSTVTRAGWAQARGLRNWATCTYRQRGRQVPSLIISAERAQQVRGQEVDGSGCRSLPQGIGGGCLTNLNVL
jgi:hypothetical protein